MSRAIRHLFACLLLVLLPFQALAASAAMGEAPALPCAEQMMDGMDCCEDDTICPVAGECAVHIAVALPAEPRIMAAFPGPEPAAAPVPALHESHIPERLQRPPQNAS